MKVFRNDGQTLRSEKFYVRPPGGVRRKGGDFKIEGSQGEKIEEMTVGTVSFQAQKLL